MAEEKTEKKQEKKQQVREQKEKIQEKKKPQQEERLESLIRIFGYDIPGNKNLYVGLTYIKGISWGISNAACIKLGMARSKKIEELTKDEIKKIEEFLKKLDIPAYMKNRRSDPTTGEIKHLYASDLDISKEFDIKRLKSMKSYRGIRHAAGQPVRGQRTKSHFRKKKTAIVGKKAVNKEVKVKQEYKK